MLMIHQLSRARKTASFGSVDFPFHPERRVLPNAVKFDIRHAVHAITWRAVADGTST
jgi:hypothetical protein